MAATLRSRLVQAAARGLLQANLGLRASVAPAATGTGTASLAAAGTAWLQACSFRASPGAPMGAGAAGIGATAAGAAAAGGGASEEGRDVLGDLLPGMSLEEEEDDEAGHYV